jgi:hypothetical protein
MTDVPGFIPPPPLPPPPVAPVAVTRPGLLERLGPRAQRRPEPRLGITLAGAGAALAVVGAIALGGDRLVDDGSGNASQYPGLAISLIVVVLGVTLNTVHRTGPLAAAGVAASAAAMLPLTFFLTYSDSSSQPLSFTSILLLSTAGWIACYLLGPGRGHGLYLGAAAIGLWLWVLEAAEHLFSYPSTVLSGFLSSGDPSDVGFAGGPGFDSTGGPSLHGVGGYTLLFAVVYLTAVLRLDRGDRRGVATPLTFAGVVTLVIGIALFSDDLQQSGTGFVYLVAGIGLAWLGATGGRRLTSVAGGVLVFGGASAIVSEPFDTVTSFALAEMAAGALVVVGAHLVAILWHEPTELEPVLSRFYRGGSVQPSGPPPPPAGSVLG